MAHAQERERTNEIAEERKRERESGERKREREMVKKPRRTIEKAEGKRERERKGNKMSKRCRFWIHKTHGEL